MKIRTLTSYMHPLTAVARLTRLALATALVAGASDRLGATELLTNGGFASGLAGWKLSSRLGAWNPLQNPGSVTPVSLHPDGSLALSGFTGVILYQNLNVTGVAGRTVTLSLSLQKMSAPSGQTVAFYLDCLTTNGAVTRLLATSPDNDLVPMGAPTNLTATVALPANVARLVRLAIAKQNYGEFNVGGLSLAADGVTVAAAPVITSVQPPSGPYHGSVTIRGQGFGATAGTVLLGVDLADDPAGTPPPGSTPQITSWSDTAVVIQPVEPNRSGRLVLLTGGVENQGDAGFTVTSPNFTVDVPTPEISALRGQKVALLLRVNFLNGFQSANGVDFMMHTPPGAGQSLTPPLKRSGGSVIQIDTGALTPGVYPCMVQSLEDQSYARFANARLTVKTVTNIVFTTAGYPPSPITTLTVTNQNQFYVSFSVVQNDGTTYGSTQFGPGPLPPVTVVSSDPNVVLVAQDNMGFNTYYAVGPGAANLTVTSVDGFSATLPVTVNLPAFPRITSAASIPGMVDNSGASTNLLFWQGSGGAISWIGYQGSAGFSFDSIVRDPDAQTANWPVAVPAGTMPGTYLFYATIGDQYSGVQRPLLMNVQNAANRGQITGRFFAITAMPYMEASGVMEVYQANGALVSTNRIWSSDGRYTVPFLAPGDYQLHFVPDMTLAAQWYANAAAVTNASVLSVAAGQTVSNVNFVLVDAPVPPMNLALPMPVAQAGGPSLPVATMPGVEYALEFADALGGPWKTVCQISGDGGVRTLNDPAPGSAARFYRVRMFVP